LLTLPIQNASSRRKTRRHRTHTSSTTRDRHSKEHQLSKLKREIAKFEAELRDHERRERTSRKNLGAFNKKTNALKAMIASLYARVETISAQKEEVDASIVETSSNLDSLKSAYAASVRYYYVHGGTRPALSTTEASAAGSAEAIDQSQQQRRNEYYSHIIGEAHSFGRAKLDSIKSALALSSSKLSSSLDAQRTLIDQRAGEQTVLDAQRKAEQERLAQIEQSKDRIKREIDKRKASARKLESIIGNLVAKEEASRSARKKHPISKKHRKKQVEEETPESADLGGSAHPHSLHWPTRSHKIVQGYGEHRNAELKTVTMNLGIEIASDEGSSVVAAADGIVSLVSTLPGYGTIVVIRHAGNLHTVYADLSGASVVRGAHVAAGEVIGESGSSDELGPSVHFEVWKGRSKQNPKGWLK
jgi:septal ring factor EnvC (AmiA/AmiB activator)